MQTKKPFEKIGYAASSFCKNGLNADITTSLTNYEQTANDVPKGDDGTTRYFTGSIAIDKNYALESSLLSVLDRAFLV